MGCCALLQGIYPTQRSNRAPTLQVSQEPDQRRAHRQGEQGGGFVAGGRGGGQGLLDTASFPGWSPHVPQCFQWGREKLKEIITCVTEWTRTGSSLCELPYFSFTAILSHRGSPPLLIPNPNCLLVFLFYSLIAVSSAPCGTSL